MNLNEDYVWSNLVFLTRSVIVSLAIAFLLLITNLIYCFIPLSADFMTGSAFIFLFINGICGIHLARRYSYVISRPQSYLWPGYTKQMPFVLFAWALGINLSLLGIPTVVALFRGDEVGMLSIFAIGVGSFLWPSCLTVLSGSTIFLTMLPCAIYFFPQLSKITANVNLSPRNCFLFGTIPLLALIVSFLGRQRHRKLIYTSGFKVMVTGKPEDDAKSFSKQYASGWPKMGVFLLRRGLRRAKLSSLLYRLMALQLVQLQRIRWAPLLLWFAAIWIWQGWGLLHNPKENWHVGAIMWAIVCSIITLGLGSVPSPTAGLPISRLNRFRSELTVVASRTMFSTLLSLLWARGLLAVLSWNRVVDWPSSWAYIGHNVLPVAFILSPLFALMPPGKTKADLEANAWPTVWVIGCLILGGFLHTFSIFTQTILAVIAWALLISFKHQKLLSSDLPVRSAANT